MIIQFEDILPIWENELWLNRKSKIEPVSCMLLNGGYAAINYEPTFWGLYDNTELIAVNSGHRTSFTNYRSRGLWVHPNHRRKGLTKILFEELFIQAKKETLPIAGMLVWSCPRKSALKAYEASGFVRISDWFDEGMEFGPNCYVEKTL